MGSLMNSGPVRKGKAFAMQIPRGCVRLTVPSQAYAAAPPIVVNSLPKSGTHLLMQIARALPNSRYYGSFIAQTPSLTLRKRSPQQIAQKANKLVPGEVIGAHLYHDPLTAQALADKNALHLFIHRDPRDVILSEAHYLAKMNKWHKMHKTFAALPDAESCVRLAITGDGSEIYPDSKERIGAYLGWGQAQDCVAFRYETLTDPAQIDTEIDRILTAYEAKGGTLSDKNALHQTLKSSIAPEKSHTFNKGGIARWKTEMSAENQALCAERFEGLEW